MTSTVSFSEILEFAQGFEPLSDMVGLEFTELELPTCDLATVSGQNRFSSFIQSRPEVMAYLRSKVKRPVAPPSSLGRVAPPVSPTGSENSEDSVQLVQAREPEGEEKAEALESTPEPSTTRYEKEIEAGRDRVYMRAVQNLQVVLHGKSDPNLGVTCSKPLHSSLAFAKMNSILRPRQPPSARRVIVSALPEVVDLASGLELHPILASHAVSDADKMLRQRIKALGDLRMDMVRCLNQAVLTAEEMGADPRGSLFFSILSAAGVVEHFVSQEIRSLRGYFYQKSRTARPVTLKEYYVMMGTEDSDPTSYIGSELPAFASLDSLMAAGFVTERMAPRHRNKRNERREAKVVPQASEPEGQAPKSSTPNRGRPSFGARGRGGWRF